jgi:hypothetical protein
MTHIALQGRSICILSRHSIYFESSVDLAHQDSKNVARGQYCMPERAGR